MVLRVLLERLELLPTDAPDGARELQGRRHQPRARRDGAGTPAPVAAARRRATAGTPPITQIG